MAKSRVIVDFYDNRWDLYDELSQKVCDPFMLWPVSGMWSSPFENVTDQIVEPNPL